MAENNPNPNPNPEQNQDKTFTQAELDQIISKRLAEERKKFPSAEELAGYNAYKAAQEANQTDSQKLATVTAERDTANGDLKKAREELEKLRHERFLLDKGVTAEDLDYFDFKISKQVTAEKTYETVAEELLKDHKPAVRIDMTGGLGNGNASGSGNNGTMNALIRNAARKK